MKFKLIFAFIFFCSYSGFSQGIDSNKILQRNTLSILRTFRDGLDDYMPNSIVDSIKEKTFTIIDLCKSIKDSSQLKGIQDYFINAGNYIRHTDSLKRNNVFNNINNDLGLKISYRDSILPLHLEAFARFIEEHSISITAFINGNKQTKGLFRIFWATNLGSDQEAIIKKDSYEGSSDTFANPYSLKIKVPGYITFWMKDTDSGAIYKSDLNYKILTEADDAFDLYFKKL